jgi:hypothetical protein
MLNAMRAVQTATTDPQSSMMLLQAAKQQLNQEWRATHPNEELGLQVDPSIWGSSFIYMP